MKDNIKLLLKEAIEELNEQIEEEEKIEFNDEVRFVGSNAYLSSINFVTLISIVEELLEDKYGKTIHLVNEKAFSSKRSPFYSIQTFVDYIYELLNEVE